MDYIYHAAVGLGISKAISGSYDPSAAVFALLPDLVGLTPFIYLKLKGAPYTSLKKFMGHAFDVTKIDVFVSSFDQSMYRMTHSLLATAVLTCFSYIFFPQQWFIYSLSYLSHILIDIPTHQGEFATRLLYPFSDIHYEGKNWAKNRDIFCFAWGILILTFILIS